MGPIRDRAVLIHPPAPWRPKPLKQDLNPKVIVLILAVVAVVFVFFAYRTYTGPSAPVAHLDNATRHAFEKPAPLSDKERNEFEEWKRTHPEGYTRQR